MILKSVTVWQKNINLAFECQKECQLSFWVSPFWFAHFPSALQWKPSSTTNKSGEKEKRLPASLSLWFGFWKEDFSHPLLAVWLGKKPRHDSLKSTE